MIDTDIMLTADGITAPYSANDPAELLRVMQSEGVDRCRVTCKLFGQDFYSADVSIADVKQWVALS